jgi:hypothetical protein
MDVTRYRQRYEAELAQAAAEGGPASVQPEDLADRVPRLLSTLRDGEEPPAARMAALQALGALDFLGPRFAPFRADYNQALRDVATDPQRALRESALELLAIDRDPYAQDLLWRGLQRPKEAMVSDAKAIQFLGYDDHAELVPLARQIFERSRGAAREEALRVLATDPKSEKLLTRLLKDKSEKSSIRRISASGLQSLNPEAFEKAARRIVADDSDYDAIRAASLVALAHGREAGEKPVDPRFVETLEKLRESTRSPAMRSSIRRFMRSTQT